MVTIAWVAFGVAVVAGIVFVAVVTREVGKATVGAGKAAVALLEAKDRNATIHHVPAPPARTADKAMWTYRVSGVDSEVKKIRVGPIDGDIATTEVASDRAGWTGARNGRYVDWSGPNVPAGEVMVLSLRTTADAVDTGGILWGTIFVNVLPKTAGDRDKALQTLTPAKPG